MLLIFSGSSNGYEGYSDMAFFLFQTLPPVRNAISQTFICLRYYLFYFDLLANKTDYLCKPLCTPTN